MAILGHLAPVRIVVRRTQTNPDDVIPLGQDPGILGHIFVRWIPEINSGRVSIATRQGEAECVATDHPTAAETGAQAIKSIRELIAGYTAAQQQAIDAHGVSMAGIDSPDLPIPVRKGFRPITARRAHAEFVLRVQREADAFRNSVTDGLQRLVVAGWIAPTLVELPEFVIPTPPWRPRR